MKALPMLDHVMLWVARIFTALILATSCIVIWYCCNSQTLHRFMTHEIVQSVTAILWLISLWLLYSKIARFCLGLSAAFFLVRVAYLAMSRVAELAHINQASLAHIIAQDILMNGIPLFGFASMIWVAVHPPQNPKTSGDNSIDNHPLPQSC
jgi:hypothetical protein